MTDDHRQLLRELGFDPEDATLSFHLTGMADATCDRSCDDEGFLDSPCLRAVLKHMHVEDCGDAEDYDEPEADDNGEIYVSASQLYFHLAEALESA